MSTLKYTLAEGLPDDWFQAPANADAGYDLRYKQTHVMENTFKVITQDVAVLKTGVHISIPVGYVGLIKGRSSFNIKGVKSVGGVIDSGYTGEIKVALQAAYIKGVEPHKIQHGDKIAQLVIVPILTLPVEKVDSLKQTERGDNGFGSTGR